MSYSTVANVRLQSVFKDSTLVSDAYVTQKIAEADSMIDGAIGEVYELPLASTPEIIESLSKAIASALLYQEQNPNMEVQPGISVDEYMKTQMDILEAIRTRKLKLFDSAGDELAVTARTIPQFYPDASSSEEDATDSTSPKFQMNQKF